MTDPEPLVLCCFLWAMPGEAEGLQSYEDEVLALVGEHRGVVLQRVRSTGDAGGPQEVQLFRFEDRDGLDGYLDDPRRLALAALRDKVVARTELFPVTILS
jgi:hypothetical protein